MVKKKVPGEETVYDRGVKNIRASAALAQTGKMHVRWRDVPFEESSHSKLKYYSSLVIDGSILPEWRVFLNEVKTLGGRHTHQGGGVIIFVLEGEGYSICDGDRIDWEPNDLILLPIKPGGVSHQHFNKNPRTVCRWIAFRFEPFLTILGDRIDQDEPRPGWELPTWQKKEGNSTIQQKILESKAPEPGKNPDSSIVSLGKNKDKRLLYWDLIEIRDKQREEVKGYSNIVKGKELAWELNPQGKMKWYLHPSLRDRIQTFLFYIQEIPPGSKSGKQKHQGGKVVFVLEGKGHSQIGDRKVRWGKYDYIGLPRIREGIIFQHFNDDPKKPARFIVVEPNFYPILGVDMGAGFQQLENAPEF